MTVSSSSETGSLVAAGPFSGFPPGRGNIRVPVGSRRAALAGMCLYAPCRPRLIASHRAICSAVALLGPRTLPDARADWSPRMGLDRWTELCDAWTDRFGRFNAAAVYEQPQASRPNVAVLLLSAGRPVAFVKVRDDEQSLDVEARALDAFERAPTPSLRTPRVMGMGRTGAAAWLALTPLPPRPHRPARPRRVAALTDSIADRLGRIPPPPDVPAHWQPMHGDLSPWNLRRIGRGAPWLLDWEDAGWGPPQTDAVYFEITTAFIRERRPAPGLHHEEAISFWENVIARRPASDYDHATNMALLDLLAQMRRT